MRKRVRLFVGLLVLLAWVPLTGFACGAGPLQLSANGSDHNNAPIGDSQDVARAGLAAPAASSPDVPKALLSLVQKGKPYATIRKQLLTNGWQPVATAMCMANVVGGNYKDLCGKHPDLGNCQLCQQMPELNVCSGDGYCNMQFRHADTPEIIRITTYGDTNGWNGANAASLIVTDWDFTKTPDK
ncbi:hypothetical protein [Dyella psychrodurans]|uniref:Uncharacterized protein n=1 Tax=Dyella psychrodurans TaxID=1927960 RepID=A0A370WXC3_9GAMM|nr:hypothetical protein [Dyella psychrodurans]RDS80706.1 hypothetical protein DWU99_19205 [Dyella psychrodurans]